jgi:hypothetical protein
MAVAIFGAPDVRWTGLARLCIRLESIVTRRVREELDVEEFGAVGFRGPGTGSAEPASAATIDMVGIIRMLAFRDRDYSDCEDGQNSREVEKELLHPQTSCVFRS